MVSISCELTSAVYSGQCLEEHRCVPQSSENLDSRLNIAAIFSIQTLGDFLFDVRLCHFIELIKIHRFVTIAVHPFQFYHIENSRRFADILVVELFTSRLRRKSLIIFR